MHSQETHFQELPNSGRNQIFQDVVMCDGACRFSIAHIVVTNGHMISWSKWVAFPWIFNHKFLIPMIVRYCVPCCYLKTDTINNRQPVFLQTAMLVFANFWLRYPQQFICMFSIYDGWSSSALRIFYLALCCCMFRSTPVLSRFQLTDRSLWIIFQPRLRSPHGHRPPSTEVVENGNNQVKQINLSWVPIPFLEYPLCFTPA